MEKMNIAIEFCMFELVYLPHFSLLKLKFLSFRPDLPEKGISGQKWKSVFHH